MINFFYFFSTAIVFLIFIVITIKLYDQKNEIYWQNVFNLNHSPIAINSLITQSVCVYFDLLPHIKTNVDRNISGVNKSPSPKPGASNFHIWASWNNQLYARRASKNIYQILTNLSIFAYLLIFIYVICCLISSNVLFIQPLAFCRNWEQRRKKNCVISS